MSCKHCYFCVVDNWYWKKIYRGADVEGRKSFNFGGGVSAAELDKLIADTSISSVSNEVPGGEFSARDFPGEESWRQVDEVLSQRDDILLGVYSAWADLSFLKWIPAVKHLSIRVLRDEGSENFASLQNLVSLDLDVPGLRSLGFAKLLPKTLQLLALRQPKSSSIDVAPLAHLTSLRRLAIEGFRKNIHCIGELHELESLSVRGATLREGAFLSELAKLEELGLRLGGLSSLDCLRSLKKLQILCIDKVLGLANVEALESLHSLQYFSLSQQKRVTALPNLDELKGLKYVALFWMKGLANIQSLASAPALDELVLFDVPALSQEQQLAVLRNPSLKKIHGSIRQIKVPGRTFEEARFKMKEMAHLCRI